MKAFLNKIRTPEISMLAGYYLYCHYVLGFLPRAYMVDYRPSLYFFERNNLYE